MSEPWKDFAPTPAPAAATQGEEPWKDFAPAPKAAEPFDKHMLGMMEALMPVMNNINDYSPARLIPGFHERELQARQHLQDRMDASHEAGMQGDPLMRGVTGLEVTGPALLASKNPAVVGGLTGALTSEAKTLEGKVADTGLGALTGKLGDVVLGGAGRFIKDAVPDAAQQVMRQFGVDLTPGQLRGGAAAAKEDRMMSQPKVGQQIFEDRVKGLDQFNRGAINKALLPIGQRLDDAVATGHDAVADMMDKIGATYDKVMPKLSLQADKTFMVKARPVIQSVANLPAAAQQEFYDFITPKLTFSGPDNMLAGKPLTVALRDIKQRGSSLAQSAVQGERDLGNAYQDMATAIHDTLQKQNPEFGPLLKGANAAYKNAMSVVNAASKADEGIFNTGQLKTGVRAADRSKNKVATATGRAAMQDYSDAARQVLPSKYPDSGTAGRAAEGKIIPTLRGYADRAGYQTNKAVTDFLADHPELASRVGGFLQSAGRGSGLLAGLRP